jgi:hypothetical protein
MLVWIFGGLFAATAVQQVLKPRLPAYRLDVRPWDDPWAALAQHVWVDNGIMASAVPAAVSFFNDNYLNLDVHALRFDLFYMDWDGNLEKIGELRDRHQIHRQQELRKAASDGTLTSSASSLLAKNNTKHNLPLWSIPGRSEFKVKDTLYIGSLWSCAVGMLTNPRFYWSLYQGRGHVAMPTTGVAHLRANGQAKLTVTFVCDNVMNTWTLTVQGVDCTLRDLSPGWTNLTVATEQLRNYATEQLRALDSGHVVSGKERVDSSTTVAAWLDQALATKRN